MAGWLVLLAQARRGLAGDPAAPARVRHPSCCWHANDRLLHSRDCHKSPLSLSILRLRVKVQVNFGKYLSCGALLLTPSPERGPVCCNPRIMPLPESSAHLVRIRSSTSAGPWPLACQATAWPSRLGCILFLDMLVCRVEQSSSNKFRRGKESLNPPSGSDSAQAASQSQRVGFPNRFRVNNSSSHDDYDDES